MTESAGNSTWGSFALGQSQFSFLFSRVLAQPWLSSGIFPALVLSCFSFHSASTILSPFEAKLRRLLNLRAGLRNLPFAPPPSITAFGPKELLLTPYNVNENVGTFRTSLKLIPFLQRLLWSPCAQLQCQILLKLNSRNRPWGAMTSEKSDAGQGTELFIIIPAAETPNRW